MSKSTGKTSEKRKVLTLKDRVEVIKHENGLSARKLAAMFGAGRTQINLIVGKDNEAIKKQWSTGIASERKYVAARRCLYLDLNESIYEWYCTARSKNIPVNGALIQEQALIYSMELNHDDFTASNGWLEAFKIRHGIRASVLSGEAADVKQDVVDAWAERLPTICKGYEMKDIFNADETDLFYRTLPNRSLVQKGDTCKGGKRAKDRITVLLAASAAGEKLKPLVIGKSAKPRCFKGFPVESLTVSYKNNKKAWMTGEIWKGWCRQLNQKMLLTGRNILLFIDNCPAHPEVALSNVKVVMLPLNTTSKLQPCNAGIIQTCKLKYRRRMLRHILLNMENVESASELTKTITVLDAILWLTTGWAAVSETTIQKCFLKCGFGRKEEDGEGEKEEEVDVADEFDERLKDLVGGMTEAEVATFDGNICTRDEVDGDDWADQIVKRIKLYDAEDEDEEEAEDEKKRFIPATTAASHLREVLDFGFSNNKPELVNMVTSAMAILEECQWEATSKSKQTTLDGFILRDIVRE